MRSAPRIADFFRGHRKALVITGSAAALLSVGAGTASAATVAPTAQSPAAIVSHQDAAAVSKAGVSATLLDLGKVVGSSDGHAASHGADHAAPVARIKAARTTAKRTATPKDLPWNQVAKIQAHRSDPKVGKGGLPAADQLRPVGVFGPQENMPISSAQMSNATTIVKQALAKKMGVRSAVIAVATSMQESMLNNISYGTSDSLGLFQQRPSCGWGTAQQIMNPAYAADSFLGALQKYQAANPSWASQPLYQAAQGVQASGFPTAYAKWEAQSASLVQAITTNLTKNQVAGAVAR